MSTVVGIMDREGWDQRTDILVVVEPKKREVLWVPRDLFCQTVDHRINHAFEKGGHALLRSALLEHGIIAQQSVVVLRSVLEKAFLTYQIEVPVAEPQEFYYPLQPQQKIEDGRKIVQFSPPSEILIGERFHQWLGARMLFSGSFDATGDLTRLKRQQVLLRRMLEERFDFSQLDQEGISLSSPAAFEDLRLVRSDWTMHTLSGMKPVTIRKMYVFIREATSDSPKV